MNANKRRSPEISQTHLLVLLASPVASVIIVPLLVTPAVLTLALLRCGIAVGVGVAGSEVLLDDLRLAVADSSPAWGSGGGGTIVGVVNMVGETRIAGESQGLHVCESGGMGMWGWMGRDAGMTCE